MEKCDRKTYSKKLKKAAKKLGKSVRTVQRLVKKWEEEGISGLKATERNDKGQHRISQEWQKFIVDTFREGNKGSRRMSRKQVAVRVKIKARELGEKRYPNYRTVYRVLQPIVDAKESEPKIRSVGWRGSSLSLKTRNGEYLNVEYSNHVWQCDHTKVDILLVDKFGDLVDRPWLTTVIDTYSRCIVGIRLGFDAPSSQVVAQRVRATHVRASDSFAGESLQALSSSTTDETKFRALYATLYYPKIIVPTMLSIASGEHMVNLNTFLQMAEKIFAPII